jgi:hypothetical protein
MTTEDYYLNLKKVSELSTNEEKQIIHDYYRDMLSLSSDSFRSKEAISIMNTLIHGGYLISIREEKIDKILS